MVGRNVRRYDREPARCRYRQRRLKFAAREVCAIGAMMRRCVSWHWILVVSVRFEA